MFMLMNSSVKEIIAQLSEWRNKTYCRNECKKWPSFIYIIPVKTGKVCETKDKLVGIEIKIYKMYLFK